MNVKIQEVVDNYNGQVAFVSACYEKNKEVFDLQTLPNLCGLSLEGLYAHAIAKMMRIVFNAETTETVNEVYEALLEFVPPYESETMKDLNTTAVSAVLEIYLARSKGSFGELVR
ncbi:hypothetical protein KW447_12440 [Vibrio fluvialis]|nr:hypothetical protein [Vibrio fluvialis]